MRIHQLSSSVANQIAAGEVIENPASVVKELLENALDANATAITVEIGFGGLNLIKISDNGDGIVADDLYLAVAPHATSKLTQLEDLSQLTSMGFRGEALASIASVSRLTLISKTSADETAMSLQVEGSDLHLAPCVRTQGTTVEVRDLFYNAPVRRRFLKMERTEYLAIEHIVKRFALSSPDIALQLKHNGRLMLELPAATCHEMKRLRVQKLFGKSFFDESYEISTSHAGMTLSGWISGDGYQRSQNDRQWIYLNQRMIKDKLIFHAVRQAYENRLYPGRHPSCLLYFTVPSDEVDVNVHPTKHEVRFLQPRFVHDFILEKISQGLSSTASEPPNVLREIDTPRQRTSFQNALCHEDATLYEKYVARPTIAYSLNHTRIADNRWMILNKQFSLLLYDSHVYLIEVIQLQRAYHLFQLQQEKLPLSNRPLLVPVSVDRNEFKISDASLKLLINQLQQYGIMIEQYDMMLKISTIPILFPQLDIKQLVAKISQQEHQMNELSNFIIESQLLDTYQLSEEDKEALAMFIKEQGIQSPWGVNFDMTRCQEMMRV